MEASWAFSEPPPALSCWDLVKQGVCCLCSHRAFLLAAFSIVEYPLQLLHSPPAPVVKRPGALPAHHPLQVPAPHRPGSLGDGGSFGFPYFYPCFPPPCVLRPALAHVPLAPLELLTFGASLRNPPNR